MTHEAVLQSVHMIRVGLIRKEITNCFTTLHQNFLRSLSINKNPVDCHCPSSSEANKDSEEFESYVNQGNFAKSDEIIDLDITTLDRHMENTHNIMKIKWKYFNRELENGSESISINGRFLQERKRTAFHTVIQNQPYVSLLGKKKEVISGNLLV